MKKSVTISLSEDELIIIHNALNEVCNTDHIEEFEFETRLGHGRKAARELLKKTKALLQRSSHP